jgi:hypothetical protein
MKLQCVLLISLGILALSITGGCYFPPSSVRVETQLATFGPVKVIHPGTQELEVRLDASHPGDWEAVLTIGAEQLSLKEVTPSEWESWRSRHGALEMAIYRFSATGGLIELHLPIETSTGVSLVVRQGDKSITLPSTISVMSESAGDALTIERLVQEARCDGHWEWPWDAW